MNKPQPIKASKPPGAMRPTVLQVLPALGPGGAERGAVEISVAVARAGGKALVASAGGPLERVLQRAGAIHVSLPVHRRNPLTIYRNAARLAELVRAHDVDIVHARSRAPAWSALLAARRTGRHFVTTYHGTYNANGPIKRLYNSVMVRGDRVIAISEFIAEHIRKTYKLDGQRLRVINRGVDLEAFDPARVSPARLVQMTERLKLPEDQPMVLLPGRLTRWKGQTVFIEALARLGRRDICAVLMGDDQGRRGYRRELVNLVHRHDLESVVRFVDHCDDMPAAMMLADVVVSASTDPEAFGRVLPEAQAMGRPVIGTAHGAAPATVLAGETGWLVPPRDVPALTGALAEALALAPETRQRMAARAIEHARANFSLEGMCTRTLAVYEELMRSQPPAP